MAVRRVWPDRPMTTIDALSLTVPAGHTITYRDTTGTFLDHPRSTDAQRQIALQPTRH